MEIGKYVPWFLSFLFIIFVYDLRKKRRISWIFGVFLSILYSVYYFSTDQLGFIASEFFYSCVCLNNYLTWTGEVNGK